MQNREPAKRFLTAGRFWDVLAALVVGFALWKMFVAPRWFGPPRALPAPHAVYGRLDGGAFHLAAQRGHVVFLEFYATWCAPCRLQLPLVEAWENAHHGALVVPVDVGEPPGVVEAFARRLRLHDVALDPRANARALFGLEGFPTVVVVDSQGYVRAKWQGLNPAIGLAMTNAASKL